MLDIQFVFILCYGEFFFVWVEIFFQDKFLGMQDSVKMYEYFIFIMLEKVIVSIYYLYLIFKI